MKDSKKCIGYQSPTLSVIQLCVADIILTSGDDLLGNGDYDITQDSPDFFQ